jgi:uncharacterized protein
MFREMRRKKQLLSDSESIAILRTCTSGVLAVTGDQGYPYTVPLSYVYKDNKLFFHVAKEGHKIDSINRNDKVTFCVIEKDEVIPEALTTHFRSVIVFGRARILTEDDEKRSALESLVEKYSPDYVKEGQRSIESEWERVYLVEVKIEHITGKAALEIVNQKGKDRAEWLKKMRSMAETLYDQFSPQYWVTFGFYENETHLAYLPKFLERVDPGGTILSAGCGAGRYDGYLLEAGYSVLGIDQSAGMLKQAREHFPLERFPLLRYEKMSFQEIDFHEAFEGLICMDAMEHVCPEDYPGVLRKFQEALKEGGMLYFTMDYQTGEALQAAYERARAKGLPVVFGEVVDEVDEAYAQVTALDQALPNTQSDRAVYHFYPSLDQAHIWIEQAGLAIEEESAGSGYYHFIAKKGKQTENG